jgi:transposase
MHRHELTDEEWSRMEPLLPPRIGSRGRPQQLTDRQFINAIVFIAKTGVPWRDLPQRFGSWQTVYARFCRWNERGVFEAILKALSRDADNESSLVDSSAVRVHQHAAGGKGGPKFNALDALAQAFPPKSTLSWTVSVTPLTST